MSIIDELIFDRTADNLVSGDAKGKYDYIDYNRVGTAVNYVAEKLNDGGYTNTITGKTDWVNTDIPRDSDMNTYRSNVQQILNLLELSNDIPTTNNNILTILGANQIEQALYTSANIIERIMTWDDVDSLAETWDTLDAKSIKWGSYFLKEV